MSREVIPAIDLMDGKCVRLKKGDFGSRKVYSRDPVALVKKMEDYGIRRVHVVDLDGARSGKIVHGRLLEKICSSTGVEVDFGGGIRSEEDLGIALNAGAAYISLSSAAVKREDLLDSWISRIGSHRFILCPDMDNNAVRISGWRENTGIGVHEFIGKYMKKGLRQYLCTDITKDGMMTGPAPELYRDILARFPGISLIASGGVSGKEDIGALFDLGVTGVIVGKALYEGAVTLKDIARWRRY